MGEEVQGPVSEQDLKHIFQSGALPDETQVWCDGMQDWRLAKEINGLSKEFKPVSSTTDDSTRASINGSIQSAFVKKARPDKRVYFVCGLILVAVFVFYFALKTHVEKSSATELSSKDTSHAYPQKEQQPESPQDDFITVDPRSISNPYITTDFFGPPVSGRLSSISKTELDLVESRGLSEQQSIYTVMLVQKFGFNVREILTEWDDLETKQGKRAERNINLWNSFLLNAFLEGKKNRDANK